MVSLDKKKKKKKTLNSIEERKVNFLCVRFEEM